MTKEQRVDACDAPFLQNGETLAFEGMKRMTDLSPSRTLVERRCSLR
jgi:hypothetical protein